MINFIEFGLEFYSSQGSSLHIYIPFLIGLINMCLLKLVPRIRGHAHLQKSENELFLLEDFHMKHPNF
jgi:hypothetical protein